MKRFIIIVSASLLALPLFGQEKSPQLKDQKDKVSYSIGMNIGIEPEPAEGRYQSRPACRRHKRRYRWETAAHTRPGQGDHGAI